jgi:hypothetical protein
VSQNINVTLSPQNLTITGASTMTTGNSITLTLSGNQAGSTISYQASGGACSVSGSSSTATVIAGSSSGSCIINATAAPVLGYGSGSVTKTITVNQPSPLVVVINASSTENTGYTNVNGNYVKNPCNAQLNTGLSATGGVPPYTASCYAVNGGNRMCSITGNGTNSISGKVYWSSYPYSVASGGASNAMRFTVTDSVGASQTVSTNLECY